MFFHMEVNFTKEKLTSAETSLSYQFAQREGLIPFFIQHSHYDEHYQLENFCNWLIYAGYGYNTTDLDEISYVKRDLISNSHEYAADKYGQLGLPSLGELLFFKYRCIDSSDTGRMLANRIRARINITTTELSQCSICHTCVPNRLMRILSPCGHGLCSSCLSSHQMIVQGSSASIIHGRYQRLQPPVFCPYCRVTCTASLPIFII